MAAGGYALTCRTRSGLGSRQRDAYFQVIHEQTVGMSPTLTAQPTVSETAGDRQIVLGTKLTAPPLRPEHIVRERLLDVLDSATTRPLALLSAPTGFGKPPCWPPGHVGAHAGRHG